MNTPQEFDADDAMDQIVYVRPVKVKDLPDEIRAEAGDLTDLFAVHAANGDRLALVADRGLAFALARQNDLTPLPVH